MLGETSSGVTTVVQMRPLSFIVDRLSAVINTLWETESNIFHKESIFVNVYVSGYVRA